MKVKITKKSHRPYKGKNGKPDGQILTLDLMDKAGTQIQATMFNATCEKYMDILQEGVIYEMSGGNVSMANKKFTSIPHDFTITFNENSCRIEESRNVSEEQYAGLGFIFKTIEDINNQAQIYRADLMVVVTEKLDIR